MLLNVILEIFAAVLAVYALRNLLYALFSRIGREEKAKPLPSEDESQNQEK